MRVLRSRGVAGFAMRAVIVFVAATAVWLPIARWYDVALVNTANALAPQGVALRGGGGEIRFYADDVRLLFGGESYALHWSITLTLALIAAGWRSSLPRLAAVVSAALVLIWVVHVVGLVVEAYTLNAAVEGVAQRSSVTRAVRGLWLATVCLPPVIWGAIYSSTYLT
jgi:hypothetical protein